MKQVKQKELIFKACPAWSWGWPLCLCLLRNVQGICEVLRLIDLESLPFYHKWIWEHLQLIDDGLQTSTSKVSRHPHPAASRGRLILQLPDAWFTASCRNLELGKACRIDNLLPAVETGSTRPPGEASADPCSPFQPFPRPQVLLGRGVEKR